MNSPDQYRGIGCVEDMIVGDRLAATFRAHTLQSRAEEVRSMVQPMSERETTITTVAVLAMGPFGVVHPAWGRQVANIFRGCLATRLEKRSAAVLPYDYDV